MGDTIASSVVYWNFTTIVQLLNNASAEQNYVQ